MFTRCELRVICAETRLFPYVMCITVNFAAPIMVKTDSEHTFTDEPAGGAESLIGLKCFTQSD